jgi:MoaA/NifB/PqqE/SkfB family radical SAM enzyme
VTEKPTSSEVANGAKADPFSFARHVYTELQRCGSSCTCATAQFPEHVKHVWIHLCNDAPQDDRIPLRVEDWLNVVDESASLGAEMLVVSVGEQLDKMPETWEICRWAQDTYDMTVALHLSGASLSRDSLKSLHQLSPDRTRIFVNRAHLSDLRDLVQDGIHIAPADVTPDAPSRTHCDLPCNMLFIDRYGLIYTCGFVKGNAQFRLGHIFEGKFQRIVTDPELPHSVPEDVPYVSNGCDGCPPLVEVIRQGKTGH